MSPAGVTPERSGLPPLDDRLVSLLPTRSGEVEPYLTVRNALEEVQRLSGVSVVAVSSAAGGDGKTTTAINVAGVLGHGGRVLLVDADLRNPDLARHLLLRGETPGLVDAVMDPSVALADVVVPLPQLGVDVLPAGRPADSPYDVIRSPRFAALLEEARGRYTSIILDTPPMIRVPEGRVLERAVDGVLLVVAANRTPRRLVAEALRQIDPAKLVGLVFNGDTERRLPYDDGASGTRRTRSGALDRIVDALQRLTGGDGGTTRRP